METLINLESFVQSAQLGSFSAAGRRLGLTPAAVSRNVARLEANLGVQLFFRSTRQLTPTEAGARFLAEMQGPLAALQGAIGEAAAARQEPAGVLRMSLSPGFGVDHILPLLPSFRARCPQVTVDWRFENRPVDLVAEGIDLAIGGGFPLGDGIVARALAPAHLVAVAAPGLLADDMVAEHPDDLAGLPAVILQVPGAAAPRPWQFRDGAGNAALARPEPVATFNDPGACVRAAALGIGIALVAVPDALVFLETGALQRLVPRWHVDLGHINLYHAGRRHMPGKTRAFIDHLTAALAEQRLAQRFSAAV